MPEDYAGVTAGGSDIIVEGEPPEQYVFFFTYRGILDNSSGFVYVPSGLDPNGFRNAIDAAEVTPIEGRWYFIGNR